MTQRRIEAACAALLATEIAGFLTLIAPLPVAWMWVGGRVYTTTGSLAADLLVTFGGFSVSVLLISSTLARVDVKWVELRRRAGHDQREGALTQVVVVVMTFVMIGFWIWFHVLSNAFIIPFMPLN